MGMKQKVNHIYPNPGKNTGTPSLEKGSKERVDRKQWLEIFVPLPTVNNQKNFQAFNLSFSA